MIFRELHLERYGLYERLSLPFRSTGLNVVFGPNEAGKSTCLSAIQDFLFGIRNNTPYGQRFGYDQMKIKATLSLADGQDLTLSRRKGRRKTLSDEHGLAIDDSVLNGILGSLSRERFSALFGLDHQILREGGESLFQAEGDIGRLILEAGGGLRTLLSSLKKLEEEADSLFAPRRTENRRFYKICDEFTSAKDEIRRSVLTVDDYSQARENLERVQKKYQQLTEDRKKLEVRLSAAERAKRVLPLLRQLSRLEAEMEAYADVSLLRPGLAQEIPQSLKDRDQARSAYGESLTRKEQMDRQIGSLTVDTRLLESEAALRDIAIKATHVEKERSSRPTRERELDDQQKKLVRLREYLRLDPGADLKEHLPPVEVREKARALVTAIRSLNEQHSRLAKQQGDNLIEEQLAKDKKTSLEQKGFHHAFDVDLSSLRALPRERQTLLERSRQLSSIDQEIASHLESLGFPDSDTLQRFQCPEIDMIEKESNTRTELENRIEVHRENLRQAEAKSVRSRTLIERLKAAGEIPTEEALKSIRSLRRDVWRPIRSVYLSPDPTVWLERPQQEREANVVRFEELTGEADRLGDRKSEEAQRIADLGALERERDEADDTVSAAGKALEETRKNLDLQILQFRERWPQATNKENDLGRLRLLSRERGALLEKADKARLLRDEAEKCRSNVDFLTDQLEGIEADQGIRPLPDASIEQRIRHLEKLSRECKEGHLEWKSNEGRLDELRRQNEKGQKDLNQLETERTRWEQDWTRIQERLGFPLDTSPESMESFLDEWSDSGSAIALTESLRHRLDQFDHDEQALASLIVTITDCVTFELPGDPVAASKMLTERLEEMKNLAVRKNILEEQLGESLRDLENKTRKVDQLDRTIRQLCDEASAPEEGLPQIAGRLEELTRTRSLHTQVLQQIQAACDGKTMEGLVEECEGRDPDAINGELSWIETEKQRMDEEVQNTFAEVKGLERELERFSSEAGINAVERRRQNALSDLKSVTLRYLEVALSHRLLQSSMNRLREEHQDPLIARAESLFTIATRQNYAGIGTDIDDRGIPIVVGKKTSGETIHVESMSDGTRDQLFLAFRIASIEQYCARAEPLPFIADDLLVNFDDDRSAAAIEMLFDLGRRTQVLLFTHHQSVREMARRFTGVGEIAIHDLVRLQGGT